MDPLFLKFEQVLRAHEESLRCRGAGLPGTKREGLTRTSTDRLYNAMIGIAERRLSKADLAAVFRELFGQ